MRVFSSRQKIHGISFHHRSAQKKAALKTPSLSSYFELDALLFQIQNDYPAIISLSDIYYFLCDQGRNEIHTHVSECVDHISKWSGIIQTMQRCFPQKRGLNLDSFEIIEENNEVYECISQELEIFLSAKKVLALWKHRLTIFEMIVNAQDSLKNFIKIN